MGRRSREQQAAFSGGRRRVLIQLDDGGSARHAAQPEGNPLASLIGGYAGSDDEGEGVGTPQAAPPAASIDDKVVDFLAEIDALAPPAEAAAAAPPAPLPPGWQECRDEATGAPYYWNTDTNAVSWERPAVTPPLPRPPASPPMQPARTESEGHTSAPSAPAGSAGTAGARRPRENDAEQIVSDAPKAKRARTEESAARARAVASDLFARLDYLGLTPARLSALDVARIEAATRLADMEAGALDPAHAAAAIVASFAQLSAYEETAAPVGWRCEWDGTAYVFRDTATGAVSRDYPATVGVPPLPTDEPPPPPPGEPVVAPAPVDEGVSWYYAPAPPPPQGTDLRAPPPQRKKVKRADAVSLGAGRKMTTLVDKWRAIREGASDDSDDDVPESERRQAALEEWKRKAMSAPEAKDNANFEPLGGDWRARVQRR